MEETIRMQTLAYFASLFYHFNEFKNFKNDILVLTPPKLCKYLSKKSALIFACPPPFNVLIMIKKFYLD